MRKQVSSAVFLLIVGLETTSSLLSSCSYCLAFNPDIQEKLHKELSKVAQATESGHSFEYESLTSCQYLDAVISESLRILAPVFTVDRQSNEDYFIEKYNLHLPKGALVDLALYAILNDAEYWPEPELFKPERFLPENKHEIVPDAYCPFGIGPRHCIGMRFSLTEAKLALAKIVMNFKFKPAPGTQFPPKNKYSPVLHGIRNAKVLIVNRSDD